MKNSIIFQKERDISTIKNMKISTLLIEESVIKYNIQNCNENIEENELDLIKLKNDYLELQAREFVSNEEKCKCVKCTTGFECVYSQIRKKELILIFEKNKASMLATISNNCILLIEETEILKLDLELFNLELSKNTQKLKKAQKTLVNLENELTILKNNILNNK